MKFEIISRQGEILETISADSKMYAERYARQKYGRSIFSFAKEIIEDEGRIAFEKMIMFINREHYIDRNGDVFGAIISGDDLAWSECKKPEFSESEKKAAFEYAKFMGETCYDNVWREFA